jgi:Ca2+-transporting ATPase
MAFMSLTFGQIIHAISCRSEKFSIFDRNKILPNRFLDVALAGSLALQGLTIVIPGLRSLLGLAPIGIADGLIVGGAAFAPLLLNEATKRTTFLSAKTAPAGAANTIVMGDQPLEEVPA